MLTKKCVTCGEEKSLADGFHAHKDHSDGLASNCKECAIVRSNKWYRDNLDKTKAQRKEYREANAEKIREQKRRYYQKNKETVKAKANAYFKENHEERLEKKREYHHKNKERVNEQRRQWNRDNPERRREQRWEYKVQKKSQLGDLPKGYLDQLWEDQEGLCYYCQSDLKVTGKHVEHMIPLSRRGLHDLSNLCLSCPDCNLSKGTKTAAEFVIQLAKINRVAYN